MYYYGYGQQCQGYNYGGGYYPYYGMGQQCCGGAGSTWAIILVLFILLVIVLGIGLNR